MPLTAGKHEVDPVSDWKVPALHAIQVSEPFDIWYLPAAHAVHSTAPVVENLPLGHGIHVVWSVFGTVPASQIVQAAEPSASAT